MFSILVICVELFVFSWCSQLTQIRYVHVQEFASVGSITFTSNRAVICAGTLIKPDIIVTSYFCAVDVKIQDNSYSVRDPEILRIQLGSRSLYAKDDWAVFCYVTEVRPHPDMFIDQKAHLLGNDAAVLEIDKKLSYLATLPANKVERAALLYDRTSPWQKFCELIGWHLGPITEQEAIKELVDPKERNNTKQALKVFYIKDEQCIRELCAYDQKYCQLNLKKSGMFCVKAKEPRFKKYGNVTKGECYNIIGNPLFCKSRESDQPKLYGMGAFINIQYCVEENIPMIMVRANVMLQALNAPVLKKNDAHKALLNIATLTILILLH